MGILYHIIKNPNYRLLSEDEEAEYREEIARERTEKAERRKWSDNESRHVLDPDREWEEEPDTATD